MAWILQGERHWLCYIHIPKTAGNWVRRAMAELGPWSVRETLGWTAPSAHGMPDRWDYQTVFATVRDPADWLRSAWGSRMTDGWRPHPERVPWTTFCSLVDPYKSEDFEVFTEGVLNNLPGIVGWLYSTYTPPPVRVLRLGTEVKEFIAELGGNPDAEPENVDSTHDMQMSSAIRAAIYEVEYSTYVRYGFEEDGSYE